MKRLLSILAITLAVFGSAKAIVVQKVILKDGTVLSGYAKQVAGGKYVIATERALICRNGDKVQEIINETTYGLNDVDDRWADCPCALDGEGDNRTVTLSDVVYRDGNKAEHVKVLEYGAVVKYIDVRDDVYEVKWSDISAIKTDRRDKNLLTGINTTFETKKGDTFTGQYAGETDNTLSLYMDNGTIQSFNFSDVVKYTYKALNPDQPLFEQSELIDRVNTKTGTVEGIIVEKNYAQSNPADNFLKVEKESGDVATVKLSDIVSLERQPNQAYQPKTDLVLGVGDVMINRTQKAEYCTIDEDADEVMVLKYPNLDLKVEAGEPLVVEYRVAEGYNTNVFQLVKLKTVTRKSETLHCFTYKSLVNNQIRPSEDVETSVNHTSRVVFVVHEPGIYALFDAQNKRAIPIVVE